VYARAGGDTETLAVSFKIGFLRKNSRSRDKLEMMLPQGSVSCTCGVMGRLCDDGYIMKE
jgi:hypothetical protein